MFVSKLALWGFRGVQLNPLLNLEFSKITLLVGPNSTSKSSVLEFLAKAWKPPWDLRDSYKELGKAGAKLEVSLADVRKDEVLKVIRSVINEMSEKFKKVTVEGRADVAEEALIESFLETLGFVPNIGAEEKKKLIENSYYTFEKLVKAYAEHCLENLAQVVYEKLAREPANLRLELKFSDSGTEVSLEHDFFVYLACFERVVDELKASPSTPLWDILGKQLVTNALVTLTKKVIDRTLIELVDERTFYVPSNRGFLCSEKIPRNNPMKKVIERIVSTSPSPRLYEKALEFLKGLGKFTRVRTLVSGDHLVLDLYDSFAGEWVNVSRAAFGACSALPAVLLLPTLEGGEVLLIDDLELGLHPAAQTKLLDLILETVKEKDVQVIMTTHSGVVFDYIIYKVVKGELNEKDVKVNVLYRKDGILKAKTVVPKVPLELDEELERALEEFGASGLFSEQRDIDWKIQFELAQSRARGLG